MGVFRQQIWFFPQLRGMQKKVYTCLPHPAAWSEDARHDLPLIACITYGENGFLETLGFFFRIFKKLNEKLKIVMEKLKKS